ncbi:MAG: M23 family metallopeptidase [bacterium]|nr:M23 family metallopeptidase [bacterium]
MTHKQKNILIITILAICAFAAASKNIHAMLTASERYLVYDRTQKLAAPVSAEVPVVSPRRSRELHMAQLAREKRRVRLELALKHRTIDAYKEQGVDLTDIEEAEAFVQKEGKALRGLVKDVVINDERVRGRSFYGRIFRALKAIRAPREAQILSDRHAELTDSYQRLQRSQYVMNSSMHSSGIDKEEILRVRAEVDADIESLQSELERIDARIRRQAERRLIDMGLRGSRSGEYSKEYEFEIDGSISWPVYSRRITAGFREPSYVGVFGVPHKGMDIAVPQGTPVYSAADGVVYTARNGGATGYSYVLIGHRGGFATLYGHLSHLSVTKGQDVTRGQMIGLSGGTPGTSGAGGMTTGAHLHLEVIDGGVQVNPLNILPRS